MQAHDNAASSIIAVITCSACDELMTISRQIFDVTAANITSSTTNR